MRGCGKMGTIDYYDHNAQSFYERSTHVNLIEEYTRFLKLLPQKAHILDAGCGGGRDSKYFLDQGHMVTAFDASREMVKYATRDTGLEVLQLSFQDLNFHELFDGVWANLSLLHVPYNETKIVFQKIYDSLKPSGIFYAVYKYGKDSMQKGERQFWNMTEATILPYLAELFEIIEIWKSPDTRSKTAPSPDKAFLSFIVKKCRF
jgi:SAM-dependent methyltransferase